MPLTAAVASRESREAEAKQIASDIFFPAEFSGAIEATLLPPGSEPDAERLSVNRWFRVVPEAHPGIQAPLGWVLSDAAQADLNSELEAQLEDGEQLEQLVQLLNGDLRCSRVTETPE